MLKKKTKRDKIEIKIKKPEVSNNNKEHYQEKLKSVRMGTPPLEERELTEDQIKFASLIAKNMPPHIAQEQCGFSDFQRRKYSNLPKMKVRIQEWREIFALKGGEKLATLFNILQEESIMLLRDRIKTGKITNQEIFKNIINKSFMPEEEESAIKKTMKITQTNRPRQKQLSHSPMDGNNVFDGLDAEDKEDDNENEVEEKRELIIEEIPKVNKEEEEEDNQD